jgi:hypothetical protein
MKVNILSCEVLDSRLKDEVVVSLSFEGKRFRGTLSEVVE